MELMYPQNDEIDILEVLKIKTFLAAQPWWTDLLRIFVIFSPLILYWWNLCKAIKICKHSLIYLSTITWILEISEGK